MPISRLVLLLAAATLASASTVAAQACIGMPTRDGEIALSGTYLRVDDRSELGGEFHADLSGPASAAFGYRTGTGDSDQTTYEGRLAYELDLVEPSLCGVAGLRYDDDPAPSVSERLSIPVGFGVGKTLHRDLFSTTIYAIPQYVWVRETRTDLVDGPEHTETSNEFSGELGLTFGFMPLLLNTALTVNTVEEEPALRIRLGLVF